MSAVATTFDPHTSLEKTNSLRDWMIACRKLTPIIEQQMAEALELPFDNEYLNMSDRIKIWDMIQNRAFGKPRQHVYISEVNTEESRRVVVLPDNNRTIPEGRIIEGEAHTTINHDATE